MYSTKKSKVLLNGGFGVVLLIVSFFSARHFLKGGWPLHSADPLLVGASALLFLVAYAFKAWGWQRLFTKRDRPGAGVLACAGGAACVGGVALPGRFDDVLRIAVVRRFPGTHAGIGAVGLSLIVLALLDNVALAPLASIAAVDARSWGVRTGFAAIAGAGVLAGAIVALLPKFSGWRRVTRYRLGRWLGTHTQCRKESVAALILISVSWALRGTAVFLLLNALSMRGSFPLALAFLCACAASAALPIAPAGAATQAGAGAAILIASGVHTTEAVAFSVAAQALVVVTGAAVVLLVSGWHVAQRFTPALAR
ncbi:MAG TPA: lysylphosphatidylglycerol synthase domain-containing protein [Gaiellaceae bacterium]|nr:lysylphosphatidylglycerol synthase domain-containing protein [Gaiellaceae bacterium]